MQPFHLACPFSAQAVCHCRLYAPSPTPSRARSLRSAPRGESTLRRALLLELATTLCTPPGHSHAPSRTLTRALFWRAARGVLPPVSTRDDRARLGLAAVVRETEMRRQCAMAQAAARAAAAAQAVEAAHLELVRVGARDCTRREAGSLGDVASRGRHSSDDDDDDDGDDDGDDDDDDEQDDDEDGDDDEENEDERGELVGTRQVAACLSNRRASRVRRHKVSITRRRRRLRR
eukprot:gb/GEZJ01001486.1/.p2 GENE.gb/GEZJ01001486.1/~~gb/GEZJ01001486.1/.p2  ORF type:complete len:233 (-),score=44.82 gb/GEZJ01001486.1/:1867-2565(-)